MKGFNNNKEKGFILVTAYLLISVLSVLSLGLFSRGFYFSEAAERNKNKMVAFNLAEAGVDLALAQLADDPNYIGSSGYIGMSNATMEGGYQVQVCPPTCDGLTLPTDPNMRLIAAVGYSPSNTSTDRGYEAKSITTYALINQSSYFSFGVFAKDSIKLTGNAGTDSFNSNDAPYSALTAGSNGDLATDAGGNADITMTGNVTIKGDVTVGPGSDPNTVISTSGNVSISGNQAAANDPYNPPDVTTTMVSSGQLKVNGNSTEILPTGTYRYSSIQVSGNGSIQALGPVTIYVDGAVSIAGNGVSTASNLPPNMLIYVTGSDDVNIGGNGHFYGGIYAPNSKVKQNGNAQLFGAVVSENFEIFGNGQVHYDEAMEDVGGNSGGGVSLKSWVENNTYSSNL